MAEWRFKHLAPGDTIRNPISQDFFSQDAIEDASEALVRESVQNSLDAARRGQTVRVVFRVVDNLGSPAMRRIGGLLAGLASHLEAEGNGLLSAPSIGHCRRYGVIEDFGTSGLRGDPRQWEPIDGVRNDFFAFFRAEGYSAKEGDDRGRWGVGKTVFPRSSGINTFFGLTLPEDASGPLLMGRCVLKTHKVVGETYLPDGYFGTSERGLSLPTDDPDDIARFRDAFEVSPRLAPDSGLSVVVPFLDEAITGPSLLRAVVRNYFYAILRGMLEVVVYGGGETWHLDRGLLEPVARDEQAIVGAEILPIIHLTQWALQGNPATLTIPAPPSQGAPSWGHIELPPQIVASGRALLREGQRQAFAFRVWTRRRDAEPELSTAAVYFADAGDHDRRRPLFVREGIVISNATGQRVQGRHALVLIDDSPLATLLGDAENVAHTEWNKDRSLFNQRYLYAKSCLTFVRCAPAEIIAQLTADDTERDEDLLRNVFAVELPKVEEDNEEPEGKGKPEGKNTPGPGVGPSRIRRFRIRRDEDGFSIVRGDEGAPPLRQLRVRMAYDLRGANPLKSWDPADFALDDGRLRVAPEKGCSVLSAAGNTLLIGIDDPDFRVSVSGFDSNRDLFVRADPVEPRGNDDDS